MATFSIQFEENVIVFSNNYNYIYEIAKYVYLQLIIQICIVIFINNSRKYHALFPPPMGVGRGGAGRRVSRNEKC